MDKPKLIQLSDGQTIPQIGLGVWKADNDQVINAIHHALDTGYRLIDTAAIYHNEEGVGQCIK